MCPAAPPPRSRAHPFCSEHGIALLELREHVPCGRSESPMGRGSCARGGRGANTLVPRVPATQQAQLSSALPVMRHN